MQYGVRQKSVGTLYSLTLWTKPVWTIWWGLGTPVVVDISHKLSGDGRVCIVQIVDHIPMANQYGLHV